MKRAIFSYLLVLISFGGAAIAFTQSVAESGARKVCPFEISGMWRSDATNLSTPFFFDFSPEGHVTLLSHSSDALPQDFEVITSVNYKLDKPKAPTRIEFMAARGNDIFTQGVTAFNIVEYSADAFTALDPASERPTRWTRERTHRYFLTFAARSETPKQGGSAFAMWTTLDGREAKVEALGVQLTKDDAGKSVPVFATIPAEVYDQVTEAIQKDKKTKEEIVTVRFELTKAEFATTHETYQKWDKDVSDRTLPEKDPYQNVMEFLRKTAEGLNQCDAKAGLQRPTRRDLDEFVSRHVAQRRPPEYIKILRKLNDELNVTDSTFPWFWRPTLQAPVQ
ncbi:MAG: hypothetical protein AABO41_09530 [Acidobacteriota bacterium]